MKFEWKKLNKWANKKKIDDLFIDILYRAGWMWLNVYKTDWMK